MQAREEADGWTAGRQVSPEVTLLCGITQESGRAQHRALLLLMVQNQSCTVSHVFPGPVNSHRPRTKPRLSYGHLDRDEHPGVHLELRGKTHHQGMETGLTAV